MGDGVIHTMDGATQVTDGATQVMDGVTQVMDGDTQVIAGVIRVGEEDIIHPITQATHQILTDTLMDSADQQEQI